MADTTTTESTQQPAPEAADQATVEVAPADLPEAPDNRTGGGGQIEVLLDTAVNVEVRLGGTEMPIRDVLALGPGSVVKLDRQLGEPVDLHLRGVRIATGHLVAVGDQIGVRVQEILRADKGADATA